MSLTFTTQGLVDVSHISAEVCGSITFNAATDYGTYGVDIAKGENDIMGLFPDRNMWSLTVEFNGTYIGWWDRQHNTLRCKTLSGSEPTTGTITLYFRAVGGRVR